MGEEFYSVALGEAAVTRLQSVRHPMVRFVSRDLRLWNRQVRLLPAKGYLARRGRMCPWDLPWVLYLTDPDLFAVTEASDHQVLHPNPEALVERFLARMESWDEQY
jgi:hypothetical protein